MLKTSLHNHIYFILLNTFVHPMITTFFNLTVGSLHPVHT